MTAKYKDQVVHDTTPKVHPSDKFPLIGPSFRDKLKAVLPRNKGNTTDMSIHEVTQSHSATGNP
jgi:hypothetical protein